MPLIDNPLSTVLEDVLLYHVRRQDAIATNLANVSTPGYTAFDLVLREQMGALRARVEPSREPAGLDGNNVNLEQELVRMMENRMRYQAAFELMDKWGNLNTLARETQR